MCRGACMPPTRGTIAPCTTAVSARWRPARGRLHEVREAGTQQVGRRRARGSLPQLAPLGGARAGASHVQNDVCFFCAAAPKDAQY
eukprot:scaffold3836_cov125-Isochrysis_galbana.AAC.13